MSWPTPLRQAPTPAATPAWICVAHEDTAGACASRWARVTGAAVAVRSAASHGLRPPPSAWAGWESDRGELGWLAVDRAWLHALVAHLTGSAPVHGPAPLSPAEEGVFAYLAAQALQVLPRPVTLIGVHGGDPDWPLPTPKGAPIDWQLTLGAHRGRARWWVPAAVRAVTPQRSVAAVPLAIQIWGEARIDPTRPPRPGDRLMLSRPLSLWSGERALGVLRLAADRLHLMDSEPHMTVPSADALPVTLTVELGELTLNAGQVAGLRAGDALPMTVDDPPVVRLRAGDVPVAMGILVSAGGRDGLAVQITRVLLDQSP